MSNLGYMEYDFSSLNILNKLNREESEEHFLRIYELRKKYKLSSILDFEDLFDFLKHDIYFVTNNEPRRRGKKVFFKGNTVIVKKAELLSYIKEPIEKHNVIMPLMIVPMENKNQFDMLPKYIITTQEDPVFEYLVNFVE